MFLKFKPFFFNISCDFALTQKLLKLKNISKLLSENNNSNKNAYL